MLSLVRLERKALYQCLLQTRAATLFLAVVAGAFVQGGMLPAQTPDIAQQVKESVIVVRPASWSKALQEWKAYRTSQGHTILEVDSEGGADTVFTTIAQMTQTARKRHAENSSQAEIGFVVLVGDANMGLVEPPLPAWYLASKALVKLGGDSLLATDSPYADIDQDDKPDLAIGRIPADSPEALKQYLERVLAYERQLDYGMWRRDVRVIAGVGGFGALADSAIEMTTSRFLTDRVPAWCDVSMTYASPNSPYCPDPFLFNQVAVQQLTTGSQFWVYIGHGHVKHLDYVRVEDQTLPILEETHLPKTDKHLQPPIAVFLACYTGAFDAREDCLAEQMVMSPGGPVACIAATRVTAPYGLACLASRMLDECFVSRRETLGQAIMNAKRGMLRPDPPLDSAEARADGQMQLITGLATALSPAGHDLMQERLEHVWQVNLLGDPLLRLHHPGMIDLRTQTKVAPGSAVVVEGQAAQAGTVTVELTTPRDRTASDLFKAGSFSSDPEIRQKMQTSYSKANNRVLATHTMELSAPGPFTCQLQPPEPLKPGKYVVRVFVCGPKSCSVGSAELQVLRKRTGTE